MTSSSSFTKNYGGGGMMQLSSGIIASLRGFGDAAQTMRVELLHGMVEQQTILDAAQKLWHETGVKASISGW
jgi:hypothetical protein